MLKVDVNEITAQFMDSLRGGKFEVAKSRNYEPDYSAEKQRRDSLAVVEFLESPIAAEIRGMK